MAKERKVRQFSDKVLVQELARRGYTVLKSHRAVPVVTPETIGKMFAKQDPKKEDNFNKEPG